MKKIKLYLQHAHGYNCENVFYHHKKPDKVLDNLIAHENDNFTFLEVGNTNIPRFDEYNSTSLQGRVIYDIPDEQQQEQEDEEEEEEEEYINYSEYYAAPLDVKYEKNKIYYTINNSKLFKKIIAYTNISNDYKDCDYRFTCKNYNNNGVDLYWALVRFNLYNVKYNLEDEEIDNKYKLYNYLFIPFVTEKRNIDYFNITGVNFYGNTYSTNNDFFGNCYKNNVFKPVFISDLMYELAKLPESKDISVFITDCDLLRYIDINSIKKGGRQKASFFDLSKTKDTSFQYLLGVNFEQGSYINRKDENNTKLNVEMEDCFLCDTNTSYFHHLRDANYQLVVDKDVYLKNVKTNERYNIFSEFDLTISKTFAQKLREGFSIENISKTIFSAGLAGAAGGGVAGVTSLVKNVGGGILDAEKEQSTYNKSDVNYHFVYKSNILNVDKLIFDFKYDTVIDNINEYYRIIKLLYKNGVKKFIGVR